YEGYVVPLEYDPLLSKLITWGKTREEAIRRMIRALSEYQIYGIKTTIPFFRRILLHPKFIAGDYDTHFIADMEKERDGRVTEERDVALIAAGVKSLMEKKSIVVSSSKKKRQRESNWKFQGRMDHFSNRL
ncbi:MAG: acetyl-CoA carboxylase biotin carboxylase subunit, partial [Candidatus Aminicenantales bacterium]